MGFLITVEGGEFTGKTSLIVPSLRDILAASGINVKVSREPGGTVEGERIRKRIFARLQEGASQEELAILFNKARQIHLREVVFPFLGRDKERDGVLILDRYLDSTRVYQGLEGGVPLGRLAEYETTYAAGYYPDLTLIARFPEDNFAETFNMRSWWSNNDAQGERSKTLWDEGEFQEHLQRQRRYLALPETYSQMGIPRRFALLDASSHPFEVIRESVTEAGLLLGRDFGQEYSRLVQEGRWDEFDRIWCKQQEWHRTSVEGSVIRSRER